MAYLGCKADGNWTDMTTWAVIHSASVAAQTSSQYAYAPTTVGYSATWAGDNTEVDGVYLVLGGRPGTTGTLTITLRNTTDNIDAATCTINVSDVPSGQYGTYAQYLIMFFKFTAAATMTTGKNFAIGVVASNGSQVYFTRTNSTANNWARYVRTTTQAGSHGAGDIHFIAGECTGQGARTDRTVYMNENSTTAYGTMFIGAGGNLEYVTNANTQLRQAGNLLICGQGRFSMGTVATPMPSQYTAIFEFDCTSNNQYNYNITGTGKFELQGTQIRTSDRALLAANASNGATVLTVDRTTGWKSGDLIRIASTDGTYSHYESFTLNADASGTTVTLPSGLAYAKIGTAPIQAELICTTGKNVIFRNNNQTYVYAAYSGNYAQIDWDWAQIGNISSSTSNDHSQTVNGSLAINNCAFNVGGIEGAGGAEDNWIFNDNVAGKSIYQMCYISNTGTPTNIQVRRNWSIGAGTDGFAFATATFPITDNRSASSYNSGLTISGSAVGVITEFTGNVCHDNNYHGFELSGLYYRQSIGTIVAYRNRYSGVYLSWIQDIDITSILSFENATTLSTSYANLQIENDVVGVDIGTLTIYGTLTFATPYGIRVSTTAHFIANVGEMNCHDHGTNSLFKISTVRTCQLTIKKGISFNTVGNGAGDRYLDTRDGFIKVSGVGGVPTAFKTWKMYGTVEVDSTYYHNAAPSQRVTPMNATKKVECGSKLVKVTSGVQTPITVYVRKSSVAAGGADYNGNQPRLIVKANNNLGITSDTVIDTMTAGVNNWEQLSGNTPAPSADGVLELVVDCDGTAGFINIDDWTWT
jgi:hypothetical protein